MTELEKEMLYTDTAVDCKNPTVDGVWVTYLYGQVLKKTLRDKIDDGIIEWETVKSEDEDCYCPRKLPKMTLVKYSDLGIRYARWKLIFDDIVLEIVDKIDAKYLVFPNGVMMQWLEAEGDVFMKTFFTPGKHQLQLEGNTTYDIRLVGAGGKSIAEANGLRFACASGGSGAFVHGTVNLADDALVEVTVGEELDSPYSLRTELSCEQFYARAASGGMPYLDMSDGNFRYLPGKGGKVLDCDKSKSFKTLDFKDGIDGNANTDKNPAVGYCEGALPANKLFPFGMSRKIHGSVHNGVVLADCDRTSGYVVIMKVS